MPACEDIRPRLSELALGDLDAEPARDVREHLSRCAACRAEAEAASRALGLLKPSLPPSTQRRLAAVRAMSEAGSATPSRRGWMAAAAGALLAATGSLVWMASRPGSPYRVAEVVGGAYRFRGSEGRPLSAGDLIRAGDQIIAAEGGSVRLEGPGTSIRLDPSGALGLAADGRLTLERGSIRVEVAGGRPLSVFDRVGTVTLRNGRASIGLQEVRGKVAGSLETRGAEAPPPEAREVASERLTVRVAEGEAELDGSHRQRLRVTAGQQGGFDFDGRPFAK